MGNYECREAVDEDEAERAVHWQAGGGRAASVLAPSPRSPHRGPQPWLEEELDPSTLARFDHEDPTMVAAATRLRAITLQEPHLIPGQTWIANILSQIMIALELASMMRTATGFVMNLKYQDAPMRSH